MKRFIMWVSVGAIFALVVNVQIAIAVNDDVGITKHRISNYTKAAVTDYGDAGDPQICVYCHTPHNSKTGVKAPLWNRNVTTSGYTMYSSPTLDATIAGEPTGVSLACLSCHDGVIGLDVILNKPGVLGDTDLPAASGNSMVAGASANFNPLLTQNLSDDHPISIEYPTPEEDDMFRDFDTLNNAGTLRFFTDGGSNRTVQCATCHNPHTPDEKFLRVDNSVASALCKTCHIK